MCDLGLQSKESAIEVTFLRTLNIIASYSLNPRTEVTTVQEERKDIYVGL